MKKLPSVRPCRLTIPPPGTLAFRRTGRTDRYDPYHWNEGCIVKILSQRDYLGHTTNFKTTRKSYKSKKKIYNSENKRWSLKTLTRR
ncbi:MAG: hypothetical protein QM683_20100 [Lacrimispora sp.]